MKPWTLGPEHHYRRPGLCFTRGAMGDVWESASYYPEPLVSAKPVLQTERRDDAWHLKTHGPALRPQVAL